MVNNWSDDARLTSDLWFAMDSVSRLWLLRKWGVRRTTELEFRFMRKHQLAYFRTGCKKLGISDDPHPIQCAKYHVLSNQLGGLDMGYQEDGDRAWVIYWPPPAYGGSPLTPGIALAAVPSVVMHAGFRAWHANNGALLGNDRLYFTLTDLMVDGGPYDAGYFAESRRPLHPSRRLRFELGNERCRPGPPPALGPAVWPQSRRDAALRKYSAQYALGAIAQVANEAGMDEAAWLMEASTRTLFVAWARTLLVEFAIDTSSSVIRVSTLFKKCFELLEDEFDVEGDETEIVLLHRKTRLSVPEYAGWETPPIDIEQAIARAWTVISRTVGDEVIVSVDASRSAGAPATRWRFKLAA